MKINLTQTSEYGVLSQTMKDLIGKQPRFEFSIIGTPPPEFQKDTDATKSNKFYVTHPDLATQEILFNGNFQFWVDYWRVSEKGAVKTSVLTNPTWKSLLKAVDQLLESENAGGIFLEGFGEPTPSKNDPKVQEVELHFGS